MAEAVAVAVTAQQGEGEQSHSLVLVFDLSGRKIAAQKFNKSFI